MQLLQTCSEGCRPVAFFLRRWQRPASDFLVREGCGFGSQVTKAGDPEATAVKIPFVLVHGRVASPSPCLHSRESHSHSIALQHQDIIKQRAAVKQEAFLFYFN